MIESTIPMLRELILDEELFVEAVLQGARRGEEIPWERVTIRPVLIKTERYLQISYFDGRQDTAKNYRGEEAGMRVDEFLVYPFKNVRVTTREETIRVQFSKKGRPIIHRESHKSQQIPLSMSHDRIKQFILNEADPPPFLQAIGVTTSAGKVRADQRRKFRQINEFLRLIDESGVIEGVPDRPLHVVDLGCGSAALTFATYHYLNNIKGIPATVTGVDIKAHLQERHRETANALRWDGMKFATGRIADFQTAITPDIVLALHACDTATDEALALAARWRSKLIFSAPCCHHHLQAQLSRTEMPEPFRPVVRHGILRERLGDILTDALRAHILRLLGYRTEVIEFVPVEHTPKNLMLRAIRTDAGATNTLVDEYLAMKLYWQVTPYLEELLVDILDPLLAPSTPN